MKEQVKGVCYISNIPPGMQVAHLRNILANHGVERIFLNAYQKKKISKTKQRNYKDGYVEFETEERAKMAELIFNGNMIGGKKRGKFYDNTICLKFQKNLKWQDLIDKKQNDKKMKEVRINTEIEQVKKIHNFIVGKKLKSQQVMKKMMNEIDKKEKQDVHEDVVGLNEGQDKIKTKEMKKTELNQKILDHINKNNQFNNVQENFWIYGKRDTGLGIEIYYSQKHSNQRINSIEF